MNEKNFPTEMMEQWAKAFKDTMPVVKPTKTGYEIRTKVLDMAKDSVWQDYYARWGQYEHSVEKKDDQIVTTVSVPQVPTPDSVLDAAKKFYEFVNNSTK